MKMNDIVIDSRTTYYLNKVKEYFDMDRNFDVFILSVTFGSYLTEKEFNDTLKYLDVDIPSVKPISIPRTVLNNEEEIVRYTLICVLYNMEKGITNESMKNKLQKIWNMDKLNTDPKLYNHMLDLCLRGSVYMYYEISENNTSIDAMIDVLDEVTSTELDQKYTNQMEL